MSRAPGCCPHATAAATIAAIIAMRRRFPGFGPKKIREWRGARIFIGEALARELVGIMEHERGGHLVRFCGRDLGLIDARGRFHRFAPPRWRLRSAAEAAMVDGQ